MNPLMVSIPEACRISGIGRSALYERISSGELRSAKVGARRLIHIADLRDFVDRLRGVDSAQVNALLELVDDAGRIDVSQIPSGTSLADLEEAKSIVARRRGGDHAA